MHATAKCRQLTVFDEETITYYITVFVPYFLLVKLAYSHCPFSSLITSFLLLYTTYHPTGDLPSLVTRCNHSHCPFSSLVTSFILFSLHQVRKYEKESYQHLMKDMEALGDDDAGMQQFDNVSLMFEI